MRIFEKILSVLVLIIFSPFLIFISIILIFDLKKSPFYRQERAITLDSKKFFIYKFRTLRECSDLSRDIFNKHELKFYTTKFTRWLRKTGIDEIPQLINVIKGDMSLIGPRPLMIRDLHLMQNENSYYHNIRKNVKSKPGISGMWQIFGDREEGIKNLVSLDIYYELNKSPKLNWEIFLLSVFIFLTAGNSDAILNSSNSYKIKFVVPLFNSRLKLLKMFDNLSYTKINGNKYKLSA